LRDEADDATIAPMDERDAAQAAELVRALRDQLLQMTRQLAWLERQDVASWTSRPSAIRCEAAALRLDISQAQILTDRLQRRYLNSDGHVQPRPDRQRHQALAEPVVPRVMNGADVRAEAPRMVTNA
jgi:hypothetical protein